MVPSDEKKREYIRRLLLSRMRILCNNGFYGLLLMHMIYSIDVNCETAATDGRRIFFGPRFLDELSDSELDFVMMHEILHVVLQHCFRQGDRDDEQFNIACDIVVNSNILLSENMNLNAITLKKYGESMHLAPDGKEGYEYTAEQVYEMLLPSPAGGEQKPALTGTLGEDGSDDEKDGDAKGSALGRTEKTQAKNKVTEGAWDDHTRWGMEEADDTLRDVWEKRFEDACEAISLRDPSNQRGLLPLFAERLLKELKKPQTDWRTILTEFIQEEITDYSFSPPDRRFEDSAFFLPDFNGKEDMAEDILFMIDTSDSVSDEMITAAYSEVKGAIDQFDGKLKGWLGFFDAAIIEPRHFTDEAEFLLIKPAGGGGTDFQIIFEYVYQHMADHLPVCIIILTDGFAPFPKEELAMDIPVLWLLNNKQVEPPWGKVARITVDC